MPAKSLPVRLSMPCVTEPKCPACTTGFAGKLVGVCKWGRKTYIFYLILGQKCSGGIPKQPQMSEPNAAGSSAPPGSLVSAPSEPPDPCGVQEDPSRVRIHTRSCSSPCSAQHGGSACQAFVHLGSPEWVNPCFCLLLFVAFFFFFWLKGQIYIE